MLSREPGGHRSGWRLTGFVDGQHTAAGLSKRDTIDGRILHDPAVDDVLGAGGAAGRVTRTATADTMRSCRAGMRFGLGRIVGDVFAALAASLFVAAMLLTIAETEAFYAPLLRGMHGLIG